MNRGVVVIAIMIAFRKIESNETHIIDLGL